ncbi:hypothetical protein IMCC9480_653 [Oxalobacteraceae bacterium IMCC9480]|nr:hypothetical protein IMCC9480_653 [Oxalobacteraceae bacterium IMCC9480]
MGHEQNSCCALASDVTGWINGFGYAPFSGQTKGKSSRVPVAIKSGLDGAIDRLLERLTKQAEGLRLSACFARRSLPQAHDLWQE